MTGFVRSAGALVALAICSACGGGSTIAPSTATYDITHIGKMLFVNGRPVTAERLTPLPRYATIVPDRRHGKDFEYVFNYYGTYASIFDYPKSDQEVGKIYGDGGQGCTNVLYGYGKKIFWNVGGQKLITEYQVRSKPLKTLSVAYSFPTSCAMDTSGDLAVGIFFEPKGGGDVVIFKDATGTPTVYSTPLVAEYFDGYDPSGNLFADGIDKDGYFRFVELPKGSGTFRTIATSNTVDFPGSVQWDGKYITVFDQDAAEFYRYQISGRSATLKSTIHVTGSADCAQTWIVKGLVYCGDSGGAAEVYKYPGGGKPVAVLTGSFDQPLGVTAAQK